MATDFDYQAGNQTPVLMSSGFDSDDSPLCARTKQVRQ